MTIPPPTPKETRIQKSVSMLPEIWRGLAKEAKRSNVTVSQLIEHVCRHYLKAAPR